MTSEHPGTSTRRLLFPWRSAALYALALGFLSLVIWRSRVWEAGDEIDDVSVVALALVPLLCIVHAAPLALRGREILRTLGYHVSPPAVAPSAYYGNTAGFVTPASSGEILRPALLERAFGVPVAQGAAIVLYERALSFYLFACAGLWAFTWTGLLPLPVSIALTPAFVIAPMLPVLAVRFGNTPFQSLGLERLLPRFVYRRLRRFEESAHVLKSLWLNARLAASFAMLTYLTFGLMLLQFWLLTSGLGQDVAPAEVWVIVVASNLAGMASALPLGLGATDAVMVALLRAYDVDLAAAGAITVLNRCLINLPTGLLGLGGYLVALRQRADVPERIAVPEVRAAAATEAE